MADYISREAAIEAFENADADVLEDYGYGACDWGFGRKNIQEVLNSVPAADVEPVRHGRWLETNFFMGVTSGRCSACGLYSGAWHINEPYRYCPFCGARMIWRTNNED